jgi:hypothetical protein
VLAACAMSFYNLKIRGVQKHSAVAVAPAAPTRGKVPWYAWFAPVVPVFLVIAFKWPMIASFLVGTFYALATTHFGKRTLRETIELFHRAFYDAFPDIATIAALWIICGMLIICGQLPQVQKVLNPIFSPFLPANPLTLSIFFALLAPLAVYRGPLNIIGTGSVLLAMFLNAKLFPTIYLFCLWRGPMALAGSQDPTNSWTLWTIGYTKVTHKEFLKTALPWGWLMVTVNAFVAYFMVSVK